MELCPVDQTPLEGKQKYCSPTCRKKASRAFKDAGVPEETAEKMTENGDMVDPPEVPVIPVTSFSETDNLFNDYRPGYYVFAEEVRKLECHDCGKKFTTRLANLRFCSPDCQQRMLRRLTGMEHKDDGREPKKVRGKKS
jgi:hypothetical protein